MTAKLPRVVVIGAGVIGAAIAWRLAEAGAKVALIDDSADGTGASEGSLAWINACSARDADYARLRVESVRLWHELARLPGCPAEMSGSWIWSDRFSGDNDIEQFRRLEWPCELLDPEAFCRRMSGLRVPPRPVLHFPQEGVADPRQLRRWFVSQAEASGARQIPRRVIAVRHGVTLADGGFLPADRVVVAAGTETPALVRPLGAKLRVLRRPGLLLRTEPAPPLARGYLESAAVHGWQAADGSILAGAEPGGIEHKGDVEDAATKILSRLAQLYRHPPRLRLQNLRVRNRPVPATGFPIIGRLSAAPHVHVAATHSGVTLAPLVGQLVAREILHDREEELPARYRPD